MARALVVQAYDADRTPPWIATCMESVSRWCAMNAVEYHFTDCLFDRVPASFVAKCGPDMGPATDLGRVLLIEEKLAHANLVVWIDADVLIFDPERFRLPQNGDFFALDEVTLLHWRQTGKTIIRRGVNGAILGVGDKSRRFGRYREAIVRLGDKAERGGLARTQAGPVLLTALHTDKAFALIDNVALLTPHLLNELASGARPLCGILMRHIGRSVAAANLCHFVSGTLVSEQLAGYEAMMSAAIGALLTSRGGILNELPLG